MNQPNLRKAVGEHFNPAFLSPLFLGMSPVLGKLAYMGGSDPFTVAAVRTVLAAVILWTLYLLFARRYLYIYPAGLLGCAVVGIVNGIGSLMYYNGLALLTASMAQLLNATYLIFVVLLSFLSGHTLTVRTVIRVMLCLVAMLLVTGGGQGTSNWLGIGLMVGNAILFAGTVILSQRVLYEMPAPTVTLYSMTTMAIVVVMARVIYKLEWLPQTSEAAIAITALGLTTALARLTLFAGVKRSGSLQTALLGVMETGVALVLSFVLLHDTFTAIQWIGVGILLVSLLLVRRDDLKRRMTQTMPMLNMAGIQFSADKSAFLEAFAAQPNTPGVSESPAEPHEGPSVETGQHPSFGEK